MRASLIAVVSALAVNNASAQSTYTNEVFVGKPLTGSAVMLSVGACKLACDASEVCAGYTYWDHTQWCSLFASADRRRVARNPCTSGSSAHACVSTVNVRYDFADSNNEFLSASSIVVDEHACCAMCLADPTCNSFHYKHSKNKCALLSSDGTGATVPIRTYGVAGHRVLPTGVVTPMPTFGVVTDEATAAPCQMPCPLRPAPVCGGNGVTYTSACALDNASCASINQGGDAITKAHDGGCIEPTAAATDAESCPFSCSIINEFVCGTDGEVYESMCHMEYASCISINAGGPQIVEDEECSF